MNISDSNEPLYSFLFYVFGVGLLEEVIKFIPVLIVFYVFRKAINEPLDYVKYICVSALGFAFGENIEYAYSYGGDILMARSILAVPGHMFFSSIFIYGIIEYKYHRKSISIIPFFMLMGALCHGVYDFLLTFDDQFTGVLLNLLFFMATISLFVNILNNCLNSSPFYSSKFVIDQEMIRRDMYRFYGLIILAVFIHNGVLYGVKSVLGSFLGLILWQSVILYVLIVRLSRFTIIENHKFKLRLEFPFYFNSNPSSKDLRILFGIFTIKGVSYNEAKMALLFEEDIHVIPLSYKNSHLNRVFEGRIEKKIYEEGRILFFLKIHLNEEKTDFVNYVLIPKIEGITHNKVGDPVAGLHGIDKYNTNKLYFHEWVILKKK